MSVERSRDERQEAVASSSGIAVTVRERLPFHMFEVHCNACGREIARARPLAEALAQAEAAHTPAACWRWAVYVSSPKGKEYLQSTDEKPRTRAPLRAARFQRDTAEELVAEMQGREGGGWGVMAVEDAVSMPCGDCGGAVWPERRCATCEHVHTQVLQSFFDCQECGDGFADGGSDYERLYCGKCLRRQRARRRDRRRYGQCLGCGCPEPEAAEYCRECVVSLVAARRTSQCVDCGEHAKLTVFGAYPRCSPCETTWYALGLAQCVDCGASPHFRETCAGCVDAFHERDMERIRENTCGGGCGVVTPRTVNGGWCGECETPDSARWRKGREESNRREGLRTSVEILRAERMREFEAAVQRERQELARVTDPELLRVLVQEIDDEA